MPLSDNKRVVEHVRSAIFKLEDIRDALRAKTMTPRAACQAITRLINGPLTAAKVHAEFMGDLTGAEKLDVRRIKRAVEQIGPID